MDFLNDVDNYEERKVERYTTDEMKIDTYRVSDGREPFETGILHKEYNNNEWIIVEAYSNKQEAISGHKKWVAKMTAKDLPIFLEDCCNSFLMSFKSKEKPRYYKNNIQPN